MDFLALLVANAQEPPEGPPFLLQIMPLLLFALICYLLWLRPIRQQEKQRLAMVAALKKNDRVVTAGGLIGIVADIKEKKDEVILKVDESSNVRLRVTRHSIVQVLKDEEPAKSP